jgi:hypothetical protein
MSLQRTIIKNSLEVFIDEQMDLRITNVYPTAKDENGNLVADCRNIWSRY